MKKLVAILLSVCTLLVADDTPRKYWIYFKDKEYSLQSALSKADAVSIGISERTMQRRAKVHRAFLEEDDLPVSRQYIRQLQEAGISVENTSRWFNAATAFLTEAQVNTVSAFPFVQKIEPVRIFTRKKEQRAEAPLVKFSEPVVGQKYSYGPSFVQMEMINAVAVHNIGISGRGVLVGMLDTGFRWREHEALQNLKVIGEYDFIQKDTVTANENDDAPSQDSHGTITMSLVGGYKEGQLISPAFNAYFMLGKTEYVPTETNVEEDNWVAAIEWMEANGVDVVSSSLGYSEFDAGQKSYTYSDMNGRTATTTKAAAIAARKGVVVVNAMGNEAASSWHYLTSPADADSIISVGAVNSDGTYAGFSSVGPTSDGRIKPDVVALGVGTYNAIPGKILYANNYQGTSLATPLVAGVAAQILSAHPELTPLQVRDALRNTANNAFSPNNQIGWGLIDAYKAVLYHGMVMSTDPEITFTIDSTINIGMYVVSNNVVHKDSITLYFSMDNGVTFTSMPMTLSNVIDSATNSGNYTAVLSGISSTTDVKFYVRASDGISTRTNPYNAPAVLYSTQQLLPERKVTLPFPSSFVLKQNYPNPFNTSTTILYDLPMDDYVTLRVFDVLGREVATVVNGFQPRKSYAVRFDAQSLASGVYFYRLSTTRFSHVRKMMLVR